jgi:hypothetical protein
MHAMDEQMLLIVDEKRVLAVNPGKKVFKDAMMGKYVGVTSIGKTIWMASEKTLEYCGVDLETATMSICTNVYNGTEILLGMGKAWDRHIIFLIKNRGLFCLCIETMQTHILLEGDFTSLQVGGEAVQGGFPIVLRPFLEHSLWFCSFRLNASLSPISVLPNYDFVQILGPHLYGELGHYKVLRFNALYTHEGLFIKRTS